MITRVSWRVGLILEIESFEVVKTAIDAVGPGDYIDCQPDVVVLDLEMPSLVEIEITRELMKHNPRPGNSDLLREPRSRRC